MKQESAERIKRLILLDSPTVGLINFLTDEIAAAKLVKKIAKCKELDACSSAEDVKNALETLTGLSVEDLALVLAALRSDVKLWPVVRTNTDDYCHCACMVAAGTKEDAELVLEKHECGNLMNCVALEDFYGKSYNSVHGPDGMYRVELVLECPYVKLGEE